MVAKPTEEEEKMKEENTKYTTTRGANEQQHRQYAAESLTIIGNNVQMPQGQPFNTRLRLHSLCVYVCGLVQMLFIRTLAVDTEKSTEKNGIRSEKT